MDNNELYHYGVLGMKWGVRKDRSSSSGRTKRSTHRKVSEPEHEDYTKAHSKKSVKSMSDTELRNRINRLQMEKQYKELSSATTSKGKRYVRSLLDTIRTVNKDANTIIGVYDTANRVKKIIGA